MTQKAHQSGVAHVNNTELYYEVAGTGHPLTLIHLLDRLETHLFSRGGRKGVPFGGRDGGQLSQRCT